MDLKEILSVSGKSGIFKIISHTKTGLLVESLIDKKRIPVYSSDKISHLGEISIFTNDEDMPLMDVFKLIYDKENGAKAIDHKSDDKSLKEYFAQVLPQYDKDRVYTSDIKKVVMWYNLLHENNMLNFTEAPEETIAEEVTDKIEVADSETPSPETKKKAASKNNAAGEKKTPKAKKEKES